MLKWPLIQELLAERMHKDLLRFLQARFGPMPADITTRLQAIEDEASLEELVDLAASCPDLEAFRAQLSSKSGRGSGSYELSAASEEDRGGSTLKDATPPGHTEVVLRAPRFRIAWLMALIAIIALDFGAIRALSGFDFQVAEMVGVGALPMANILAVGLLIGIWRREGRPSLFGFEAFGAVPLSAYVAWAWSSPDSLSSYLQFYFRPMVDFFRTNWPAWHIPVIYAIAAVLLALPQVAFALVGGWLSSNFGTMIHMLGIRRSHSSR